MKDIIVNKPFEGNTDATHYHIQSYTRSELARQYMPGLADSTARKKFNRWLRENPELQRELESLPAHKNSRTYTAQQVRAIYKYFGLPVILEPYY